MNKLIFTTILILTLSIFGHAQSKFPELDKAREIKLLQSNRKDVKRILKGFKHDKDEDNDYRQTFSTKNADIEITFSKAGTCGGEDSTKIWDVTEWKVIRIEINPTIPLRFEDLGVDISSFRKEQYYANVKDLFVYHNKNIGIAFEVDEKDVIEADDEDFSVNGEENVSEKDDSEADEDNIERIFVFPTSGTQSLLCDNEATEEYRDFYKNESYFWETNLEERLEHYEGGPPSVTSLTLSTNEITIGCNNFEESESCSDSSREISVKTVGYDAENDPLTYTYNVSGGKVIGSGTEIIWDLTGVEPGTYTITAGANDGCGICGQTRTETVIVKECDDCLPK